MDIRDEMNGFFHQAFQEEPIHDKESRPRFLSSSPTISFPRLRLTIGILVFLALGATSCIHGENAKSAAGPSNPITRKLVIDPSSTAVRLGKARLIVSPLLRRNGNYAGEYHLKVRPYFFKSETGALVLAVSEDAVRKLRAAGAIDFTGKALTHEDGSSHVVLGRATPSSGDRGTVTFSIVTQNGNLVFNTSYHFEK
jgi:hypothetical protein